METINVRAMLEKQLSPFIPSPLGLTFICMHDTSGYNTYIYGTFMISYARLMRAVAAGMGVAPTARLYIYTPATLMHVHETLAELAFQRKYSHKLL